MRALILPATVKCDHGGRVANAAGQVWVRMNGSPVLAEPDPVGRSIAACPNSGPTIKMCTSTGPVTAGYSSFIRIGGARVCLDSLTGFTDGTPPGVVTYSVVDPAQHFVDMT